MTFREPEFTDQHGNVARSTGTPGGALRRRTVEGSGAAVRPVPAYRFRVNGGM
ncbi:MAG: hypothetical protein FWJ70_11280 [Micromonosporaceae bacterium]